MASCVFTLASTLTVTLTLHAAVASAQTSWATGASLPVARYEAPSAAVNGKVYVVGGFDSLSGETVVLTATPDVLVYDPASSSWTQLASIPTPGGQGLTHHGVALDGDRFVWTAAGFLGDDPGTAISTVWKYDIALNTWTTGPSLPAARAAGGLVRVGRTLHYIGGVMADRDTDATNHYVLNLDNPVAWTSAAPFPTPRNHFSTVVLNGKIYTIGGQRGHDTNPFDVADVEVYDPGSNSWSTAADSPIVRSHFEPGTFVRDGRIVAVGGQSGPSTQIADITEYDPLTDTWSALTPLPVALRAPVAQSVGSKIVIAGGGAINGYTPTTTTYIGAVPATNGLWSTLAPLNPGRAEAGVAAAGGKVYVLGGNSNDVLLNTVSVYDPVVNTWSSIAPLPGPARDHVGAASVDEKIYAIGGLTNWPGPSFGGVYMYDPANPGAGWTTRASLPADRGAMGVGVINGKIYVTGGLSGSVHVNHLTVYDPVVDTWTTLAPMATARDHLTAAVVDGKLYAIGGRFTDIVPVTGATEVYDPATNSWSTATSMLTARGSVASSVLGGRIFVFGADTGTSALAVNEEYDPATNNWRAVTPMPTPRSSTGGAVVGGRVFAPGGKSQSGEHNLTVNESFGLSGSAGSAVYRINVGGGALTDSQGRAWSADSNFAGTSSTFAVGQPIIGTVDDALYQKVRYGGAFSYALPVANATYTVVVHVAELWFTGAGRRVFDVAAEGGVVLDNLDVWATAGQYAALTRTFQTTVADGVLNLAFTGVVDNANVSAIEVLSTGGGNQAPQVSAGPDQTITLPAAATLSGAATDDGLPTPPGAVTYTWSRVSGPGTVTFGAVNAASTTATFSTAGVYTLRLTASDSVLSGVDDLVVTVSGGGGTALYRINVGGGALTDSQGRAWSADSNFAGTSSTFAVGQPISGTVDDALYQKVRYGGSFSYALPLANATYTVVVHVAELWFTGAGQRVFDVAAEGGVVVDNLDVWATAGQYAALTQTFQTTVADGVLNLAFTGVVDNANIAAIEVLSTGGNLAPQVSAGPDQTITLPAAATLSGAATDDGLPTPPGAVTYTWSRVSGPGTVAFGAANAANTTATFSTAGVYTLRLTASDSVLSGVDDLVVTVSGGGGTALYRINVGGGALTDSQGRAWSADSNFAGTSSTFAVGQPISGTVDDVLYQKVRYGGAFSYALPLANATYTVVVHVAELWFTGAGQRVFDVAAEGVVMVDNLDVWAAAGQYAAVTRAFQTTVTDGVLNLAFTGVFDNANVAAIEVLAGGASCGSATNPTVLTFSSSVNGTYGNSGFGCYLPGTVQPDGGGLLLNSSAGHLVVASSDGDLYQSLNTQQNALAIRFANSGAYAVRSRIKGPFVSTVPYQSAGLFLALNADNYAKLAVGHGDSGPRLEFGIETGQVHSPGAPDAAFILSNLNDQSKALDLWLVRHTNGAIEALYRTVTNLTGTPVLGPIVSVGSANAPQWTVSNAELYGGLFTTDFGTGGSLNVLFDEFELAAAVTGAGPLSGGTVTRNVPVIKCPNPSLADHTTDASPDVEDARHTEACDVTISRSAVGNGFSYDQARADVDGDGLANSADQLHYDKQNGSRTLLPLALDWNPGGRPLGGIANTGFGGAQIPTYGPRTDDRAIHIEGGYMGVAASAGTAKGAANSQVNGLQVGFDSTRPFHIWSRIAEPFHSAVSATGHFGGIFIGPDQDNFLRLGVVGSAGGEQSVQLGLEASTAWTVLATSNLGTAEIVTLDLHLVGEPESARMSAYYEFNQSGAVLPLGEVPVPSGWFTDNQATPGTSMAGIMISHGQAQPTIFWYDFFRISGEANFGPLLEKGGLVSVEAENYDGLIARAGNTWNTRIDREGFSGSAAMSESPDGAGSIDQSAIGASPELRYLVRFKTPGTYHVWLRGLADDTGGAVQVSLDGALSSSTEVSLPQPDDWIWANDTVDGRMAILDVRSAGNHVVTVSTRTNGLRFDSLLLTTDSTFVPSGDGPAKSRRLTVP